MLRFSGVPNCDVCVVKYFWISALVTVVSWRARSFD
jgi:hypothetical protein